MALKVTDNRKTVISRPSASDKMDNLNKTGNKDSIKLVATKDVEDIIRGAQDSVNEIRQKLLISITDILFEPDEFGAKTELRNRMKTLNVHDVFELHKAILRRILHAK